MIYIYYIIYLKIRNHQNKEETSLKFFNNGQVKNLLKLIILDIYKIKFSKILLQ